MAIHPFVLLHIVDILELLLDAKIGQDAFPFALSSNESCLYIGRLLGARVDRSLSRAFKNTIRSFDIPAKHHALF